jgi:hypothetical protein
MPAGLRWFAEYQPFTPIIETLRGLLMGTPIDSSGVLAVAWCVGIGLVGTCGRNACSTVIRLGSCLNARHPKLQEIETHGPPAASSPGRLCLQE